MPVETCILVLLSHDNQAAEKRSCLFDRLEHTNDRVGLQPDGFERRHEIVHRRRVPDDEHVGGRRRS